MKRRDRLQQRLLDSCDRFVSGGGRFVGSLPDRDALQSFPNRAEAQVLEAVLAAHIGDEKSLVAYSPRDSQSPLYECASDLAVAAPHLGCVIIEVKSHRVSGIRSTRGGLSVVYPGSGEEICKPVFPQVERWVSSFKDRLRRRGKTLRLPRPPVTGVVAFPRVSRSELIDCLRGRGELPDDHLLLEEDLDPESVRGLLERAARSSLAGQRMKLPAKRRAIDLVALTLGAFPRGLRGQGRHEEDRVDGSLGARIDEMRGSNCLRLEQRKVADRTLEGRPTLLRGVAGSGKSILLAQGLVHLLHRAGRASRCADDPDAPRVLVTCFNKTLVPLLRRDADAFAVETGLQLSRFKLDFVHFEGVLKKLREEWGLTVPGLRQGDDEANDARYPMVFRQVEELFASGAATEEEALWDFVLVDEAQDLHPDALRLLHRMARVDPKTRARGIAIYYDDAQNLYGRPRPIWRDLGIHVTGGRAVQLNRSRRTSRPIATFAFNVLLGSAAESATQTGARGFVDLPSLRDDDLVIETDAGFSIEFAQRPGPAPELWISTDAENEIDDVVTRIGDLTRAEDVRPEEILVQTASQWEYLEPLRNALEAQDIRTHWVLDAKDELITQPGRVTLSTIQSAKGYDAPVVFVVGAQELGTDLESRARFYVGATRAQLLLVVTGHGEPAALLGEMKEVRRRLPALQPGCEA